MGSSIFLEPGGPDYYGPYNLYVPKGSKRSYELAETWNVFPNIQEFDPEEDPHTGEEDPNNNGAKTFYFSASKTDIASGKCGSLPVSMINEENVIGLQFDVMLPEGLSLAKNEEDLYYLEMSDRFVDHYVSSSEIDGKVRFIVVSNTNSAFNGKDGVLFNIPVEASGDPRQTDLVINNIKISNAPAKEIDLSPIKATINVLPPYILGDANNDGVITIADVTYTVADILGNTLPGFVKNAVDIDGNGSISIADVTGIIEIILNQPDDYSSQTNARSNQDMEYALRYENVEWNGHSINATVSLENASDYIGVQFDMIIPDGFSVSEVKFSANNKFHKLAYAKTKSGNLRVVIFSMSNAHLTDNNLLTLSLIADTNDNIGSTLGFEKSRIVEITSDGIIETTITGESVYISDVAANKNLILDSPIIIVNGLTVTIFSSEDTTINVTDLSGKHKNINAISGTTTFRLHSSGIYIINGKKYIAK